MAQRAHGMAFRGKGVIMFCPHCNASVADGSKFCPSCGKPLETPEASPQTGQTPQYGQPLETSTPATAPVEPTAVIPPVGAASQANAAGTPTTPTPGYTPPGTVPPAATEPWYGKTWVIILFLIFFWPVGLILMWMKTCKWEKAVKVVVTVLFAVYVAASIFFVTSMMSSLTNLAATSATQSAVTSTQPSTNSGSSSDNKDSGSSSNSGSSNSGSSNSGNSGSSGSGSSGSSSSSSAINYSNTRYGYSCTLPAGFTLLSESANGDGATYFNSQYNMTVKVFGFNNTDGMDGSQLEESWWNGSTSASTQNIDNLWMFYQYDSTKEYVYAAYVGTGSIVEVDIDFPLQSDNTDEMDIASEIMVSLTPGDLTVAH